MAHGAHGVVQVSALARDAGLLDPGENVHSRCTQKAKAMRAYEWVILFFIVLSSCVIVLYLMEKQSKNEEELTMKRLTALVIALILSLSALPAFAAGNIRATNKSAYYVLSRSDGYRVYYYAVVTNEGDKRASVNDLLFEIRDHSNTDIESTSKYTLYPEILDPGQSGWLVITKDVKDIDNKSTIDHFALTITTKAADDDTEVRPLSAEATYLKKDEDDNEDVLRATVTNDGSENAFKITVAMAVRDEDGKLLYITGDATKDIGLAPCSALLMRSTIRSDIMDEIEDAGARVAAVEAIAYRTVDTDD